MMDYLTASFYHDIRFNGREVSFDFRFYREVFDIYATIIHHIIKHYLKWEGLPILNVQPSEKTLLSEFLTSKAIESELCVQAKGVNRSWNIGQEDYFNDIWFKEKKPAVITMGDKYGQIEITKQLAKLMKKNNIIIPIFADGFVHMMEGGEPETNFDCFKVCDDRLFPVLLY